MDYTDVLTLSVDLQLSKQEKLPVPTVSSPGCTFTHRVLIDLESSRLSQEKRVVQSIRRLQLKDKPNTQVQNFGTCSGTETLFVF